MKNRYIKLIGIFALIMLLTISVIACKSNETEETGASSDITTTDSESEGTKKPFAPVLETKPEETTEPQVTEDTSLIDIGEDSDTKYGSAVDMH